MDDPRPAPERKPLTVRKRVGLSLVKENLVDAQEIARLKPLLLQAWNRNDPPANEQERDSRFISDVYECRTPGKLYVIRTEMPNETRKRWQSRMTEDNSHHSAIVSNHWHSQAVTAYDLAVSESIAWSEQEKNFYDYICEVADWRIKVKNPRDPNMQPQD